MLENRLDLIDNLAILQGKTYGDLRIIVPNEDLSDWEFRSSIKDDYNGNVLAVFTFFLITYGFTQVIDPNNSSVIFAGDGTTINGQLTASQTAAIPANKKIQSIDTPYRTCQVCRHNAVKYYYEIEAEKDGTVLSIVSPSIVEVYAEVLN